MKKSKERAENTACFQFYNNVHAQFAVPYRHTVMMVDG